MASSFKSKNLFGSGPNVFVMGVQGELAPLNISLGIGDSGSTLRGLLELNVTVTGTLVDNAGRTWTNMTFISYTETAVARGRAWSVGYKAVFRRMAG